MQEERIIHKLVWPEGKERALTLSYDDGVQQDRRLVALLRKYGVKATFNLNSGRLGRTERSRIFGPELDISTVLAEEVPSLYEGFEVATHGRTHSGLTHLGALACAEVLEDRIALEKLVPYLVRGHAYPYGSFDDTVKTALRAAGIRYARAIRSTHSFDLPKDYLEWNPTCHHTEPELMPLIRDFCEATRFIREPLLFYLWGHSYEFDQFDNWEVMEQFLQYVSVRREQIWFAANGEIVRYLDAAAQLQYSADGKRVFNPTAEPIWLMTGTLGLPWTIHCIAPGKLLSLE